MQHRVVITANAKANLLAYFQIASKHAPATAVRWLDRFEQALHGLSEHPERCAIAPESDTVGVVIRQLLFGRKLSVFRVFFSIDANEVRILHIRRGVMNWASESELFGEP